MVRFYETATALGRRWRRRMSPESLTVKWLSALQQMSDNAELDRQRETLMVAAMLAGGEGTTLLGKPVRFRLEWPEGRPYGMTDEQLRQFGEELKDKGQ